ncbi:MAG: hypothetical protein GY913_04050 [Proteobacteria bacterium]|nr:hypothetical protein [Pseudomonadota bacterium]MCP4916075.1 hypothetical protein [Pseudomonadota bacterium]
MNMICGLLLITAGCVIGGGNSGDGDSDDVGVDTGSGGGNNTDVWRARGKGSAYLLDGTEDHSLFSLEISSTMEPREGEAYHGWLTGGPSALYLGEIPVTDDVVLWETDVGLNAFASGYTTFQAYAGEGTPSAPGEGELLWYGEIPTTAVEILEDLLVSSPESDEGSLRAIETTTEAIIERGQSAMDDYVDLPTFQEDAEAVRNGIAGTAEDANSNGNVGVIEGLEVALVGDNGQANVILEDFVEAFDAFGGNQADEDIREALDKAYDCVQRIDAHANEAYDLSGTGTVCGAESSCISIMSDVNEQLGYALSGEDTDGNGTVELDEGTIDCAIEHTSRMMAFEVGVP